MHRLNREDNDMNRAYFYICLFLCIIVMMPAVCGADAGSNASGRSTRSSKKVTIPAGTLVVTKNTVYGPKVKLVLSPGAAISVNTGVTLTIQGVMQAPVAKVFTGAGEVVFDTDYAQVVYPQWWGAKGDGTTEDTAALQAAVNSFTSKGGTIAFPAGTYVIDSIGMKSNITLKGTGDTSILKQKSGSKYAVGTDPSIDKISQARNFSLNPGNMKFSKLAFRGTIDTDGFSEFIMLLNLKAATQVSIDSCTFTGFRGDGIYLGAINLSGTEYHNSKISVTNCAFDGLNRNNRNGISVIDCDGLLIQKCRFSNCSRSDMPGAIDVEPNNSFNIVKNIKIDNNTFTNIGGGTNILLNVRKLDSPLQNIEITGNVINGDGLSNGIYFGQPLLADSATPLTNLLIGNNTVNKTNRAFVVFGGRNIIMTNNVFDGCEHEPYISYSSANVNVMDMQVTGNTFRNLSRVYGIGIYIFGVENITFTGNLFDNIGMSSGGGGNALMFGDWGGPAKGVVIKNNTFKGSNTTVAIQRASGNITYPELNVISGNTFLGTSLIYLPAQ